MPRKTKRRGPGEGTIYKQEKTRKRKDGTVVTDVYWSGEIYFGKDADGKKQVERFSGKSYEEVLEKMDAAKSDRRKGILTEPTSKETVKDFLERWLRDSVKHSVRPHTYRSYENNVRNHIVPETGSISLKKLTPAQIQQLYAKKLESGLSPRSVQDMHAILYRALKQAAKWGFVPRNVCDAVDRPKVERQEMQVLDGEQVKQLLKAAAGDRLEALYVLAVTTGMRQGEILGLSWPNVDLDKGVIRVRQQLQWLPKVGFAFSEPKTKKGLRTIPLTATAVTALKKHRARQNEGRLALGEAWRDEHDLVFTTTIGTPIDGTNLVPQSFKPLLKKAKLPGIRFHDLRHTAATLLLQAGVHVKVVSEMLGHASITLTLDTYSHVLPVMQDDAASKLEAILGDKKETAPKKRAATSKKK
ncbi:MAG: site-specific integrase [Candidatus Desulforudis sp.]|nr:site-specific integrase [Desulforudis sp.]